MRKLHPEILWARFQGHLRRSAYKKLGTRPASWPFASGDGFRALADHVWDEQDLPSFGVEDVKENEIVFVSWHLWRFLTEVGPQIRVPFYLITSNSDYSPSEGEVEQFKKSLGVHWWATNLLAPNDERVSVIPLGLQNERFCWFGDVQDFKLLRKRRRTIQPLARICWGFAVENAPAIRGPIREALRSNPFADELPNMDPYSYRRELMKYQYVASPPGNGPDAHRTWEALALGVIPLVLETRLIQNLRELNFLPDAVVLRSAQEFESFVPKTGGASP